MTQREWWWHGHLARDCPRAGRPCHVRRAVLLALKGHNNIAQGSALGQQTHALQEALKGRNRPTPKHNMRHSTPLKPSRYEHAGEKGQAVV